MPLTFALMSPSPPHRSRIYPTWVSCNMPNSGNPSSDGETFLRFRHSFPIIDRLCGPGAPARPSGASSANEKVDFPSALPPLGAGRASGIGCVSGRARASVAGDADLADRSRRARQRCHRPCRRRGRRAARHLVLRQDAPPLAARGSLCAASRHPAADRFRPRRLALYGGTFARRQPRRDGRLDRQRQRILDALRLRYRERRNAEECRDAYRPVALARFFGRRQAARDRPEGQAGGGPVQHGDLVRRRPRRRAAGRHAVGRHGQDGRVVAASLGGTVSLYEAGLRNNARSQHPAAKSPRSCASPPTARRSPSAIPICRASISSPPTICTLSPPPTRAASTRASSRSPGRKAAIIFTAPAITNAAGAIPFAAGKAAGAARRAIFR